MNLNRSFRLSFSSSDVMLKAILTQLLVISMVIAIAALLLGTTFEGIMQIYLDIKTSESLGAVISDLSLTDFDAVMLAQHIGDLVFELSDTIANAQKFFETILSVYVIIFIVILIYRFLISIVDIPMTLSLADFSQTSGKRPFIWYFIKYLGKSSLFSIMQIAMTMIADSLILFGGIGLYIFILSAFGVWGLIGCVILVLFAYSVRQTIFAFWLPAIALDGMGVRDGLKHSFTILPRVFWKVLWKYMLMICLAFVSSLVINFFLQDLLKINYFAVGLSALLTLMCFFIIRSVSIIEYLSAQNKPFFYKKVKLESENF